MGPAKKTPEQTRKLLREAREELEKAQQPLLEQLARCTGPETPWMMAAAGRDDAAVAHAERGAQRAELLERRGDRVAAAFAGLDGVATSREGGVVVVDLGACRGAFTLAPNDDARTVSLLSPVSGAQTYKWDARAEAWKHVDDGHDVTGLLVRDYLRAGCVGLPDL